MTVEYTIASFRQNLRQAFNEADQGDEVLIERYGEKYRLVAAEPDKKMAKDDTKLYGKGLSDQVKAVQKIIADDSHPEGSSLCEHGREAGTCMSHACPHNPNKP